MSEFYRDEKSPEQVLKVYLNKMRDQIEEGSALVIRLLANYFSYTKKTLSKNK